MKHLSLGDCRTHRAAPDPKHDLLGNQGDSVAQDSTKNRVGRDCLGHSTEHMRPADPPLHPHTAQSKL